MVNEYALNQAKNSLSNQKDERRRIDCDLLTYQTEIDKLEDRRIIIKKNIEDLERAIVILEEAGRDHANKTRK